MTLEEFFKIIENSDASDWTVIGRPIFAQDMQQVSGSEKTWIEVEEHHSLLSLRTDLSVSIAVGLPENADFFEEWARGFADRQASSVWVDFRYNGVPVFRALRVLVDGARAGLPCPAAGSKDVPERQYRIWALIDEVTGSGRMSEYFNRAALNVVSAYWPTPAD